MARKVLQYFQNICQTSHKNCFASLFVLRLYELLLWWMLLTDATLQVLFFFFSIMQKFCFWKDILYC